jgi:glycosyltransferase involved in cell wall biosynthesis
METLVSCIMPTCDRRSFVPRAIDQFLRQDYPHRELVIVDDGVDCIRDLVPDDPRIRYLRLEGRHRLGAKRNLACAEARGDVIAHWDDDDWMAPWRLTYQVGELLRRGADACGLDRLFFFDPKADRAWQYAYPAGNRGWAAGATLCYTRALWERNRFPEIDIGEDNRFLAQARPLRLALLEDNRFYVARIHPRNTSRKAPRGALWRKADVAQVKALLGEEAEVRAAPIAGPSGPTGSSERSEEAHVTVSIPFHGCPEMLRRAVLSILGQTHTDLTLVVVNDGGPPPWPRLADIDDPRLVRFDLAANQGLFFAHAVVLNATASPYFLTQDADDWSEPHRITTLLRRLRAEGAAGAVSASLRHYPARRGARPVLETFPGLARPLSAKLQHPANHHGLFRTEALCAVGGYYGGFRIGYDTLLMNLLLMTGRLACVGEPLYHRTIHPGSLTNAPATGMRSAARQRVAAELGRMYTEAFAAYRRHRTGALGREELAAALRRIIGSRIEPEQRAALDREALRLRELLPARAAAQAPPPRGLDTAPALIDRLALRGHALGIGLLTGGRLSLLRRTIDSLLRQCPGLLEESVVVALLNGDDPETAAFLEGLPFIDEQLRHGPGVLPIGAATSLLMETLARRPEIGTILHLEDDWVAQGEGAGWLERGRRILDEMPGVGQVRLRHAEEKVLTRHMVTGRPLCWERRQGFLLAASAHFTFNPSLIRAAEVPAVFPCGSETEAQRRFLKTGLATAQLLPGVFRHTGGEQSRRLQIGPAAWREDAIDSTARRRAGDGESAVARAGHR